MTDSFTLNNGVRMHRFSELVHDGMRTGRHLILDVRSLAYTVEAEVSQPRIRLAVHDPAIGVLDQSNLRAQGIRTYGDADSLGSCTGNAGTYAVSSLFGSASTQGHVLDEQYAIGLYSEATTEDTDLADRWPPTDSGSSGLGVCRALRHRGAVSGYRWARSLHGVAALLQGGGVMIGTPWMRSWFEPDRDGFVDTGGPDAWGPCDGGHEVYVAALEAWDERRPERSVVRFVNSWGSWGDAGSGRMRLSTYLTLRKYIDVKQIVT